MNSTQDIPLGPIMTSVSDLELDQENKERLLSPVVGGVVLFADNCDSRQQIQKLTNDIHQLRNPPLMIAIDQEGGRVQRIKCDVTQLPPQARYGEIFDENSDNGCDASELGGYLMAREMLEMGIDISFSPVLDIATVDSDVIGDRSFHSDPLVVSTLAEAWIRGMQNAGMHSVGKHFPGHGGVSQDSHMEMPEDNRLIQDVLACDLLPYRRLGDRLSAVMTAHVLYPEITSAIPTYSSFWLDHVLREVIAFYGVVFSDDLSMSGAGDAGDMETRVLTALSSGCDIALICQSASDTDEAIEAMTRNTSGWRETTWYYDRIRPEVVEFTDRLEDCREQFMNCIE